MDLKLDTIRSIHFVGIKGIAMASLAAYCVGRGIAVTGSDVGETFPSDDVLHHIGVIPSVGFAATHITSGRRPDLVIYTGAHHGRDNVEVQEAHRLHIPVLPHGRALGFCMQGKKQLSVAGCHGKTTTTSMIATILTHAGADPSYAIGSGMVGGLGLPGHFGKSPYFIAEADEYITDPGHDTTPRFLWQHPHILVVTNIDYDHPDAYASLVDVQQAYETLAGRMNDTDIIVVNSDDPQSMGLAALPQAVSVGQSESADWVIRSIRAESGKTTFSLGHTQSTKDLTIQVPGRHNVQNGAMAAVAAHGVGASWEAIERGLLEFTGAKRRFEQIGQSRDILLYDDYAHHPKEIRATISAARDWFGTNRIIVVFQPHTFTRTRALLDEFAHAFTGADEVILAPIYASARETVVDASIMKTLVAKTKKVSQMVTYKPSPQAVVDYVVKTARAGDIIICMGAGDIYTWEKEIVQKIQSRH